MEEPLSPGEILARAVGYPYDAPLRSFVQLGDRTLGLPPQGVDLSGRRPLLCYGANAAPAVLTRKLATLPEVPLPLLRAGLHGFDVVYSAHISPYGAVPSTLQHSPGTIAPLFVAYPTGEQEALLTVTEPNYELRRLTGIELRREGGVTLETVDAYVSRHGCLALEGSEVALAAVESAARHFPSLGEVEVLERVRHVLAPELDLERFVESSLDPGLAAARTAVLHGGSRSLEL
ncbi:MAG TPA: hypothetical protein VLL27_03355 [Solirubrobacterales bacterium]|nr:hypothetical protein [Solirubrobacterales bacterium]